MGGNVFGTTDKIKREDIKPTLLNFLKEFKRLFPKAEPHFRQMQTLGSVGKKEVSGDIDLAISNQSFDKIEDWGLDQAMYRSYSSSSKRDQELPRKSSL